MVDKLGRNLQSIRANVSSVYTLPALNPNGGGQCDVTEQSFIRLMEILGQQVTLPSDYHYLRTILQVISRLTMLTSVSFLKDGQLVDSGTLSTTKMEVPRGYSSEQR